MILDPTDFLIYDLRLSDFYLSTNAFLNRKSQFINYKLIDSFIFNFQLSIIQLSYPLFLKIRIGQQYEKQQSYRSQNTP